MKRVQPYYYIVLLAGLFILAGMALFSLQLLPSAEGGSMPVDPLTQSATGDLYDLWFTGVNLYDLSIDHNLTAILFSADNNKVSLLDRDRKLRWDKIFATAPLQAKLSSCGNYAAVGTAGGRLHFTTVDQQFSWDDEGDPVKLLAISPNGAWIAAFRANEEQGHQYLELYNQAGDLQWTIETGPILNLYLSSEYLEQTNLYYTALEQELPQIYAVSLDGRELWAKNNQVLAAVSRHGSRIAAVQENRLIVYDALGYELWSSGLPVEPQTVLFNPQNYNRVLVYGSREEIGDNFFYFDLADDLLWMKNIEDGSLFAFTADGRHIVTSSWRHYKEDYTQMKIFDHDGLEVNNWEAAMRVEHLLVSGHPTLVVIGGDDGYIDLIDLKTLITLNGNGASTVPLYSPASAGISSGETKVTLFFNNESGNLIPVTRAVSLTDNPLQAALDELVRGPARGSALYRTIPGKEARMQAIYEPSTGRLTLDLSPEFLLFNGEAQSLNAFNSLIYTVSASPGVEEILIVSEGVPLEQFGQINLEQPLKAHRWQKPLFIPSVSGNRYYLTIQELADGDLSEADLKEILTQAIRSARSTLAIIPNDLAVIELKEANEQLQINFNRSFKEMFTEETVEKEVQQITLFLDSIFLTVFRNSRAQRADILVNGESWTPPAGYPALGRFYRQPCYINPEF
jgi:WD40 repeat protein